MSQAYLLPCSCGHKVRVTPAQAGGRVKCTCGQSLAVPTLRGLRGLTPAKSEPAARATPRWTPLHGALFSGGLLLAAAGLAVIAYHLWLYAQIGGLAVDRSSEVIAHEAAHIDELSPWQTLDVWWQLADEGLGEKVTPIWIAAKDRIAQYMRWIALGGGAIIVGAVLVMSSLFVGRGATK